MLPELRLTVVPPASTTDMILSSATNAVALTAAASLRPASTALRPARVKPATAPESCLTVLNTGLSIISTKSRLKDSVSSSLSRHAATRDDNDTLLADSTVFRPHDISIKAIRTTSRSIKQPRLMTPRFSIPTLHTRPTHRNKDKPWPQTHGGHGPWHPDNDRTARRQAAS